MHNAPEELEDELRRLAPHALSDALRASIRREIRRTPAPTPHRVAPMLAAAAVVLLLAGTAWLMMRSPLRNSVAGTTAGATAAPERLFIATVLLGEQTGDRVMMAGDGPARPVRRVLVDHAQWYDAKQGALFAMTVPRKEVRLVPLEMY